MKRILFLVDRRTMPGDIRLLRTVLRHCSERGADVHLAVLADDRSVSTDSFDRDGVGSVTILPHLQREAWRRGYHLRRLINRLDPDAIHAWDHQSAITAKLACAGMTASITATIFETPREQPFSIKLIASRQLRKCRLFPCHSSLVGSMLELDWMPVGSAPAIIRSGVSIVQPEPQESRQALLEYLDRRGVHPTPGSWLVGTWNRLSPHTHIKDLIWATALLNVAGISVDLLVFGEGAQYHSLRQYAELTEVPQHVHFLDHDWDSVDILPGLDAYWNSGDNRPNPSEMLLAMASSVPVISALVPATADIVIPQATALATNFGARDEVARWTKYLLEQPGQRQRLTDQARDFVADRFPVDRMLQQYESVLAGESHARS